MRHSKLIFTLLTVLLFLPSIFAQNKPEWIDSVKIDGKLQEWKNAMHYYDKTSTMRYGFGNDASYLYLAFQVIEPAGQMRIMSSGLNITLKTKSKPKVSGNLHLTGQKPDRESVEQMSQTRLDDGNFNQKRNNRLEIFKNLYLMAKPTIQTEGFLKEKETLTSGEGGVISFQIAWSNQNQMCIECRIPLSELFGENFNLSTVAKKEILLSVEQAEEESHGSNFRMGMSGGGQGMRNGEGGYGRGAGQGMHEGEENEGGGSRFASGYAPDKIEFKNNIVLATEK